MGKIIPWMGLIALATILVVVSICKPHWLSDENVFLQGFVNHEFLGTLGFVVAVTLASAGSIHLALNRLEDETGHPFRRTRRSLSRSAISLIVLLGAAVLLVVVKPLTDVFSNLGALMNSIAILIIYFYIFTLYDLTKVTLHIPTKRKVVELKENGTD